MPSSENDTVAQDIELDTEPTSGVRVDIPEPEKQTSGLPSQRVPIPYYQLYRHADSIAWLWMGIGALGAGIAGCTRPLMTLVFSGLIDAFTQRTQGTITLESFQDTLRLHVLYFVALAVGMFVTSYVQMVFWDLASARQTAKIRKLYVYSILRQSRSFFDTHNAGELSARLTSDVELIGNGTGEKVGLFIQAVCTLIAAIVIAVVQSWRVSLVLGCLFPIMGVCSVQCNKWAGRKGIAALKAYAEASNIVEETISSIRTVMALGGQERARRAFEDRLGPAQEAGITRAKAQGLGVAGVQTCMYLAYAIAFFYGSYLITKGELTSGRLVAVYFALVIGTMRMSSVAPELAAFNNACSAAAEIFGLIDREPDHFGPLPPATKTVASVDMENPIRFENVSFAYPARPSVKVLDDFSIEFETGKTTALVGQSGSGKSTIISMMERWYEPASGVITINSHPLRNIDTSYWRNNLGLVSQEPVLFDLSIEDNIALGAGSDQPRPTHEQVVQAAILANAHQFIEKLPEGYKTNVGDRGSLLSGGQKQRVAIARALIRNPKILLLDEATSALDATSERVVQDALDKASNGRTTIVVAHKLSTIRDAHRIIVLHEGRIVQQGTHKEMVLIEGSPYKNLVDMQSLHEDKDARDSDDDEVKLPLVDEKVAKEPSGLPTVMHRLASTVSNSRRPSSAKDIEAASLAITEVEPNQKFYARLLAMHRPEAHILIVGMIAAIASGAIFPVYAILYGYILQVFALTDLEEMRREANGWASGFLVIAAVAGLGNFGTLYVFGATAEKVTSRLRARAFSAILAQEAGWFDRDENRTGVLVAKIATDTARVNLLVGTLLGTLVQLAVNIFGGIIVALVVSWKITVVVLVVIPCLIFSGAMQMASLKGFGAATEKAHAVAANTATQAIQHHATVISLDRQDTFLDLYEEALKEPDRAAHRQAFVAGAGYAAANGLGFLANALAFYWGGTLFGRGEVDVRQMFTVMIAIVFGSMASGRASGFAPDIAKAKFAALALFSLLDRTTHIDVHAPGAPVPPAPTPLSIEFKNVDFAYPTRGYKVITNLNLTIESGTCVALVGPSGSGKSTITCLLERFYDPDRGDVLVNGQPLSTLDLQDWREQVGYVGQEPVLFQGTIRDNIAYGSRLSRGHGKTAQHDNTKKSPTVSDDDIVRAAKDANVHDFVMRLPQGYDTPVGPKATQLSGGQRQRIAIARALIQDPRVLLLDEATSALDTESERLIQDALNRLLVGRTAVVIAHRLSTIQNADKIVVLDQGAVAEIGKHAELIAQGGIYATLVGLQSI